MSQDYVDFSQIPGNIRFRFKALPVLVPAVSHFFGCEVEYIDRPGEILKKKHGIDIQKNPLRNSYVLDNKTAIVLGSIMEGRAVRSALALKLTNGRFNNMSRLLNFFGKALGIKLRESFQDKFNDASLEFGDSLIRRAIAETVGKGFYEPRKVIHLIDLFQKLASTTFEARNFTTGLILSRSLFAYAGARGNYRHGDLFRLQTPISLRPGGDLEKRFWYLVDGQSSFFMCEKNMRVSNIFILIDSGQKLASFTDAYTLSHTLQGGDALFRVTSRAEFSITFAGGLECNYKENNWRVRDLSSFADIISAKLDLGSDVVQNLLYYALYLSRRRLSSIIWVPESVQKIDDFLLTQNTLTKSPLSIKEHYHAPTITRLLSSDGVTVIDTDGNVLSFGCIVDSSKINVTGIKGTGESVAGYLSTNGVAIKISQDGNIKIFAGNSETPTIF